MQWVVVKMATVIPTLSHDWYSPHQEVESDSPSLEGHWE